MNTRRRPRGPGIGAMPIWRPSGCPHRGSEEALPDGRNHKVEMESDMPKTLVS
ncbi:hypothetical protein GCM10009651_10630 [Microbacterium natoriense]